MNSIDEAGPSGMGDFCASCQRVYFRIKSEHNSSPPVAWRFSLPSFLSLSGFKGLTLKLIETPRRAGNKPIRSQMSMIIFVVAGSKFPLCGDSAPHLRLRKSIGGSPAPTETSDSICSPSGTRARHVCQARCRHTRSVPSMPKREHISILWAVALWVALGPAIEEVASDADTRLIWAPS